MNRKKKGNGGSHAQEVAPKEKFKRKDYDLTIIAHTEPLDIDIYARDDYYFNYRSQPFKDLMRTISRTQPGEMLDD